MLFLSFSSGLVGFQPVFWKRGNVTKVPSGIRARPRKVNVSGKICFKKTDSRVPPPEDSDLLGPKRGRRSLSDQSPFPPIPDAAQTVLEAVAFEGCVSPFLTPTLQLFVFFYIFYISLIL